jgi:hypothetical protein
LKLDRAVSQQAGPRRVKPVNGKTPPAKPSFAKKAALGAKPKGAVALDLDDDDAGTDSQYERY